MIESCTMLGLSVLMLTGCFVWADRTAENEVEEAEEA